MSLIRSVIKCEFCERSKKGENWTNWQRHLEACRKKSEQKLRQGELKRGKKSDQAGARTISSFFGAGDKKEECAKQGGTVWLYKCVLCI